MLFKFLYRCCFVTVVLINGCKHDPFPNDQKSPHQTSGLCDPDTVYFENTILPLLKNKCAMPGCHAGPNPANNVNLTNYNDIINTGDVRAGRPDNSDLYEVITENRQDKRMPPPPYPPLSADEINQVRVWILQGAKNNKCSDCDTTQVTFLSHIEPLVKSNCYGCHNSDVPSGQLILETYNQVRDAVLQKQLLQIIDYPGGTGRMPPAGPLSACNLQVFNIWVAEGMPLN
jgi:hypothetical protein